MPLVESSNVCACTGIRHCLLCNEKQVNSTQDDIIEIYWHCPECGKLFEGDISSNLSSSEISSWCLCHSNKSPAFELKGINVVENFIAAEEEIILINEINNKPWKLSQSGRRKQDFGPKVNFKQKKLKLGNFNGLPSYSKILVKRMNTNKFLVNFTPVELCNLEYTPERGSSIDPHIDDTWLWGKELVTVNLLSRTLLTLTSGNVCDRKRNIEIQIPMPARSLVILDKEARYEWKHGIKPNHIIKTRVAMTFRNLSSEFDKDGINYETGKLVLDIARLFTGKVAE